MNEGGRPVRREPPSERTIKSFEEQFELALPEDYLAFLRHSNGGHPERNAFIPIGSATGIMRNVDRFYCLNDNQSDLEGLWAATRAWRTVIPGKILAIGSDGGGNQLLLSFEHDPPSVEFCLHEDNMRLIHVADSFGEFIDMLCE